MVISSSSYGVVSFHLRYNQFLYKLSVIKNNRLCRCPPSGLGNVDVPFQNNNNISHEYDSRKISIILSLVLVALAVACGVASADSSL